MIGRWDRAKSWLRPPERRVLDLGCAFGFGTARLTPARHPVGVELSWPDLVAARRRRPDIPWIRASASALPFPAGSFDAVLLLDVLEHVRHELPVLAEVARVLRPGGALILSIPHRGLLAGLDSLNLYDQLRHRLPAGRPLPETAATRGRHRHYSRSELERLLQPWFAVERTVTSGLGVVEVIHLALLLLLRGLVDWPAAYLVLRYVYFAGYILEDFLPGGPIGYHLTLRATRVELLS